ncbi:SMP-30/Gluconolaconase/LRE-like region family protein [Burkholderia pseudomallei MSHR4303]|nr:SMP-30/Gluconolaconase/LRE-like region family protein [Burkholderia pseudomallei MSHR4303]
MVAVRHRLAGVALAAFACGALAHDAQPAAGASSAHAAHMAMDAATAGAAQKTPLATGAAFDARHRLWVAWVEGQHVVVAHSDDAGRTLAPPVTVNALPEPIYTSAENRPKLAASPDGRAIYVTWSMPLDAPYTGMVRFSRSLDGGATWSVPVTVHRDRQAITHRFDMLTIDPQGRIFVAWIDKRDLVAAQRAGRSYDGAAIYYAVSTDGGATFEPERKVSDHTCECCRIAMTVDSDGRVQAAWRNVFPGQIRDHAVAVLHASADRAVEPVRATFSNWHVEACPDHGPALAITADGVRHLAWFGVVDGKADVFYSRSMRAARRSARHLRSATIRRRRTNRLRMRRSSRGATRCGSRGRRSTAIRCASGCAAPTTAARTGARRARSRGRPARATTRSCWPTEGASICRGARATTAIG